MAIKFIEEKVGRTTMKLEEFGSLGELTDTLAKRKNNMKTYPGRSRDSQEVRADSNNWTGSKDYQEAQQLLVEGWATEAKKLAKRVPAQTKSVASNKTKPVYSVVGGQASVPRYLQGIPTNMIDKRQTPMKSKIIVINKDFSFPGMVSSTEILEEGVKALQIIQTLEGKGYRVKLNMAFATRDGNEICAIRVTVKKPEERFSLLKMAFPLAHPAMLRRIGFRWIETCPFMVGRYGSYGAPATTELKNFLPDKEIFLPRQIPDVDKFIADLKL